MLIYKDGVVAEYKSLFPNVSFPASGPDDSFLESQNSYKVNLFKSHDRATQKLVPCDPYVEDGWAYTVAVVDKTPEDIAADIASAAAGKRAERDRLLKESDWTQTLDAPVDRTAWAVYRQALRDVPSQAGFPFDVQWPTQPE